MWNVHIGLSQRPLQKQKWGDVLSELQSLNRLCLVVDIGAQQRGERIRSQIPRKLRVLFKELDELHTVVRVLLKADACGEGCVLKALFQPRVEARGILANRHGHRAVAAITRDLARPAVVVVRESKRPTF